MTKKETKPQSRKNVIPVVFQSPHEISTRYWYKAILNVAHYQKRRDLQEVHKLIDDRRVTKGLELYRNKAIIKNTVTTHRGGDVHAVVQSEKNNYTIIIKNYLPETLPQRLYEREEYIADLYVDCTCQDHIMSHYRDNSAMLCKHICAVLYFLIHQFNMPKIFLTPEEKMLGYKKSNTIELETDIKALPLIKFTQHINILLLKEHRGMESALALSIHRVNNETHVEDYKPQWLTYCELPDVMKLIKGITTAYKEMASSKGVSEEEIQVTLHKLFPIQKKKWWWNLWRKKVKKD